MAGRKPSLDDIVYKRGEILRAVDDQPRAKPALTEAVAASRSTVDRGVDELEDVGCIERQNGKYHTTLLGELSCERYRAYRSSICALEEARDLLAVLPRSARMSTTFLCGADVRLARSAAPEAALQPAIDRLASADQLRGFAPVGLSLYVDLFYEYADQNEFSAEIVVQYEALQPIIDLDRQRLRELLKNGSLTIFAVKKPLDYALWLMNSSEGVDAGMAIYEDGGIAGHLMNSSEEGIEWAQSEYNRRRDVAEEISPDDLFDS